MPLCPMCQARFSIAPTIQHAVDLGLGCARLDRRLPLRREPVPVAALIGGGVGGRFALDVDHEEARGVAGAEAACS